MPKDRQLLQGCTQLGNSNTIEGLGLGVVGAPQKSTGHLKAYYVPSPQNPQPSNLRQHASRPLAQPSDPRFVGQAPFRQAGTVFMFWRCRVGVEIRMQGLEGLSGVGSWDFTIQGVGIRV